TMREYGWQQLRDGEAVVTCRRHLDWYLELSERAEPHLQGPEQQEWLERLEREHDNLRVALDRAVDCGEVEEGLRLAGALWFFWSVRGYFTEGRSRLSKLLELCDHDPAGAELSISESR